MTISRSSLLRISALLAAGVAAGGAGAQAPIRAQGSWETYFAPGEGIQKLLFLAPGRVEGTVYFRCRPREGRVRLIDMHEPRPDRRLHIVMAGRTYHPPARLLHEETGDYVEVAIPADHPIIAGLARGNPIIVNAVQYRVASAGDRRAVAGFRAACLRPARR